MKDKETALTKIAVDALLLNPPITKPQPYISIPTLASYLKAQNMTVAACDVNSEFFNRFLIRENLQKGISHATDRFIELNEKNELPFSETLEYILCYYGLRLIQENFSRVCAYLLPFSSVEMLGSLNIDYLAVMLSTLPYFPEILITKPHLLHASPFHEFSSDGIIESTGHPSFYSDVVTEITKELLDKYDPRVIGISITYREQAIPGFFMARIIKELSASRHITIGGTFVSSYMRSLRNDRLFKYVDSFVIDEGEIPLAQLIRETENENPDLAKVQNLIYLKDGKVCYTEPAEPLDLERLSPPDYTVFSLGKYLTPRDTIPFLFRTARGCPWQKCTFCRTEIPFCKNFQQPPYPFLYEQFIKVVKDTGAKRYYFTAESADPLLLEYFSRRMIEDKLGIAWICHTRVDARLTGERCSLYRDAGCERLFLGVESMNDRILKLMKKGITVSLIDKVLHQINSAIPLELYMIAGFPGETMEEAMEGFSRLQEYIREGLANDYHYAPFQVMKGSEIWNHPEEYGITRFNVPASVDLDAEICDFESAGMKREEAYKFIQKHSLPRSKFFPELYQIEMSGDSTIELRDRDVEIRFEIRKILENIDSLWEFSFLPRDEWMKCGDRRIVPIKPRAFCSSHQGE